LPLLQQAKVEAAKLHWALPSLLSWRTSEHAAAIRSVYPEPCYSTYRNQRLEDFVLGVRKKPIEGNRLNNSVYFYRRRRQALAGVGLLESCRFG